LLVSMSPLDRTSGLRASALRKQLYQT